MERQVIDPRLERIHSDRTRKFNEEELKEFSGRKRFSGPKQNLLCCLVGKERENQS